MSKHTLHGFITHTLYPWQEAKESVIGFFVGNTFADNEYTVAVKPHSIEVEVPANFNPNPAKVTALKAKIEKIKVAAWDECQNVQAEIEKLLCLSYEAPAADASFDEVPQDAIDLNTVNMEGNSDDVPF
jgi:hypothetical protein